MNILISGPTSFINEWIPFLSAHTIYAVTAPNDAELAKPALKYADYLSPAADFVIDLALENAHTKSQTLNTFAALTKPEVPLLTNTVCTTATALAQYVEQSDRLVGMAYLPSMLEASIVELTLPFNSEGALLKPVADLFAASGKSIEVVDDYPGLVFPRVIATIINEAVYALQQGVAGESDIDTAMKLGVNYPEGQLAWGKKIGYSRILRLLQILQTEFGDDRYRPAPLLRKLAMSDFSSQT